jgi:hypothetical protein
MRNSKCVVRATREWLSAIDYMSTALHPGDRLVRHRNAMAHQDRVRAMIVDIDRGGGAPCLRCADCAKKAVV